MSLYDYRVSQELGRQDIPFAALIMAAYRRADTGNSILLESAFPEITREFRQRYEAPGGVLPGEREVTR